ncbi:hypothetical protein QJS66_23735 (plasmid) [Kocuria rhizophila]|nr:hypothetical protein QJS66_23735 [Kocuria rhizophila]
MGAHQGRPPASETRRRNAINRRGPPRDARSEPTRTPPRRGAAAGAAANTTAHRYSPATVAGADRAPKAEGRELGAATFGRLHRQAGAPPTPRRSPPPTSQHREAIRPTANRERRRAGVLARRARPAARRRSEGRRLQRRTIPPGAG